MGRPACVLQLPRTAQLAMFGVKHTKNLYFSSAHLDVLDILTHSQCCLLHHPLRVVGSHGAELYRKLLLVIRLSNTGFESIHHLDRSS